VLTCVGLKQARRQAHVGIEFVLYPCLLPVITSNCETTSTMQTAGAAAAQLLAQPGCEGALMPECNS
jgi:hypothetical protein